MQLVDRGGVMSRRPATIQIVIDVDLPRPRDLDSRGYLEKRNAIFSAMGINLRIGEAETAK